MTKVPITKSVFGPEEFEAIQEPLRTGWVVQGPFVKRFESEFAKFSGARHAAATTSCTTALHACMAALGLRPGDEVIVPAFTWVATPNVVEYQGAKPVFCDIDPVTFNISPDHLESLITHRTVGIIPVHLFGLCADMEAICAIAQKNHLWVVEDAACGFGAFLNGRHSGTFGDAGCFSFHPRKAITTGEGGMITTGREDLHRLVQSLRDHGATKTDLARHSSKQGFLLADYPHLGYNYRMTDIQAALGCAQLARADKILKARAARATRYDEALEDTDWLRLPQVAPNYVHGYQSYVCRFMPNAAFSDIDRLHELRNQLMLLLEEQGIATRQGTHAPFALRYYTEKYGYRPEQFPASYAADRLSLTLPLYPEMTDEEQDLVISSLMQTWNRLAETGSDCVIQENMERVR